MRERVRKDVLVNIDFPKVVAKVEGGLRYLVRRQGNNCYGHLLVFRGLLIRRGS